MYCNVLLYINSPGANDFHYPAAPDNLTVSFYYRSRYNCKYPALNISWKIRLDGKLYPCKRCQQICTLGQSAALLDNCVFVPLSTDHVL